MSMHARATHWLGTAALVISLACGQTAPSTPTPTLPPPPPPGQPASTTYTVSGTVFEHAISGVRPQAGVPVRVRVWGATPVLLDGVSDSAGRYEISGVPQTRAAITIAPPSQSDYRAPCPSGSTAITGDASFDVHVVSTALLSTSGVPASIERSILRVEGTVIERVSDGVLPVAGATVDLADDDSDRWVFSTTLTDARGRYLACEAPPGTGTDQVLWVRVQKDGYRPASREGFPGVDFPPINLEIVRK
jgi:hypothetical protein